MNQAAHIETNDPTRRSGNGHAKGTENRATDPDWSSLTTQAFARLHEFIDHSLSHQPSELAMLDTSSGLLYRLLFQVNAELDAALAAAPEARDRREGLARTIDLVLRLTRQIDRLGHLRRLLQEARQTLPETRGSEEVAF